MPEPRDPQRTPRRGTGPGSKAGAKPAAKPGAKGAKPATRTAAKPGAKAGAKPAAPSSATFRRRRIVVLVVLALILAAVATGIWALVRGGTGEQENPGAGATPSSSTASEAVTTPTPTPEPTPTPTEEPSIGETLPLPTACTPEQAAMSLVVPGSSSAGSPVGISVEVATTTGLPCLVDLGSAAVTIEVRSGDDLIWTSAHCPSDPAERELLLPEGATDSQLVTWPGNRSAEGCAGGQPTAEPGTYRVIATQVLQEVALTAEATFVLR